MGTWGIAFLGGPAQLDIGRAKVDRSFTPVTRRMGASVIPTPGRGKLPNPRRGLAVGAKALQAESRAM